MSRSRRRWFIMWKSVGSLHRVGGATATRTTTFQLKSLFINWIIIFGCVLSSEHAHGYDELHIGGIFPIAGKMGWQGGQACMPAARMALEDVNNQQDLLPGFRLTLHSNDSEVSRKIQLSLRRLLLLLPVRSHFSVFGLRSSRRVVGS